MPLARDVTLADYQPDGTTDLPDGLSARRDDRPDVKIGQTFISRLPVMVVLRNCIFIPKPAAQWPTVDDGLAAE